MFMELLGAGTSLLGSIGAYKKEKAAVKAYNKQIDSQLQQTEREKTRIGIDNKQAQDWATMQIAKAGSNFNAANAVSNMYNGRITSNGERYNQLESRRIELADKKISKPKFSDHLLSSIPSIAGSALAMADMFPEAEKKANGFVDRISDYVRRTREERLVKNAINDSTESLLKKPDNMPEVINHNLSISPTFLKKDLTPFRKESIRLYDPARDPFYYPLYIDTLYKEDIW